ncbi:MAG: exodeoxyribonuclease V subunit alpha [Acidimicrobiales bacterium]|nr:exodeoxyribonuclease V subunit alpha [Acidimicrobiales bacterium]
MSALDATTATPGAIVAGDPFDGRRPTVGAGLLRALGDATVLAAADVRTALTLVRLADTDGTATDPDGHVALAAALAVRAVRLGHVHADLATAATTVAPDDEEVDVALVAALPWPEPEAWVAAVAAHPLTAVGADGPADRPLRLIGTCLYLDRYWRHERAITADLLARVGGPPPAVDAAALADGLDRLFPPDPPSTSTPASSSETGEPANPDDDQRRAATTAVERRFSVVAGGPGTGKTTTVARILALLHEQAAASGAPPPRVALAAPTGKAAARLTEAVHAEAAGLDTDDTVKAALRATTASTLHRLLGWRPGSRSRFRHDAANQLPHNVVIVDESSMVGLSMMAKLLDAVRPTARLVLVGDPRQLASVEAGAVLGDIVASPLPGSIVLRRVHRFGGSIATVARAIESGDGDAVVDALRHPGAEDVTWLEIDDDADPTTAPALTAVRAAVVDTARAVVAAAEAGDAAGALEALRAVQVLCAHRRGPAGAARWRSEIERWLRSTIPGYGAGPWYPGRPLMVTENDYALGVFNGDSGVVIDAGDGLLRAVFERRGEPLVVRPTRLASVESLYAITIHKSQGSQFGHVVVRLPDPGSPVLTRELLYTAVTRAQQRLTVLGTEAAVRAAVARPVARASGLTAALTPP